MVKCLFNGKWINLNVKYLYNETLHIYILSMTKNYFDENKDILLRSKQFSINNIAMKYNGHGYNNDFASLTLKELVY